MGPRCVDLTGRLLSFHAILFSHFNPLLLLLDWWRRSWPVQESDTAISQKSFQVKSVTEPAEIEAVVPKKEVEPTTELQPTDNTVSENDVSSAVPKDLESQTQSEELLKPPSDIVQTPVKEPKVERPGRKSKIVILTINYFEGRVRG